jgi:hypothetical protein
LKKKLKCEIFERIFFCKIEILLKSFGAFLNFAMVFKDISRGFEAFVKLICGYFKTCEAIAGYSKTFSEKWGILQ